MTLTADLDLTLLDPVLAKYRTGGRTNLLPALHEAQKLYTYLPEPVLKAISAALRVPLSDVYGVVEFYTMFYGELVGRRIVRLCTDPACAIAGAEEALAEACKHAGGIQPGETVADGSVTVERVTCLGLCDQAPAHWWTRWLSAVSLPRT